MFSPFQKVAWSRQFAAVEGKCRLEKPFSVSTRSHPPLHCPLLGLLIFSHFQLKSFTFGNSRGLCLRLFPEGTGLIPHRGASWEPGSGMPAKYSRARRREAPEAWLNLPQENGFSLGNVSSCGGSRALQFEGEPVFPSAEDLLSVPFFFRLRWFLVAVRWLSLVAMHRLIAVASLLAEHGL